VDSLKISDTPHHIETVAVMRVDCYRYFVTQSGVRAKFFRVKGV